MRREPPPSRLCVRSLLIGRVTPTSTSRPTPRCSPPRDRSAVPACSWSEKRVHSDAPRCCAVGRRQAWKVQTHLSSRPSRRLFRAVSRCFGTLPRFVRLRCETRSLSDSWRVRPLPRHFLGSGYTRVYPARPPVIAAKLAFQTADVFVTSSLLLSSSP